MLKQSSERGFLSSAAESSTSAGRVVNCLSDQDYIHNQLDNQLDYTSHDLRIGNYPVRRIYC